MQFFISQLQQTVSQMYGGKRPETSWRTQNETFIKLTCLQGIPRGHQKKQSITYLKDYMDTGIPVWKQEPAHLGFSGPLLLNQQIQVVLHIFYCFSITNVQQ